MLNNGLNNGCREIYFYCCPGILSKYLFPTTKLKYFYLSIRVNVLYGLGLWFLRLALGLGGGVGGTVVRTLAFHLCDLGSIPAQCSYLIKIPPWSHVRRVLPV